MSCSADFFSIWQLNDDEYWQQCQNRHRRNTFLAAAAEYKSINKEKQQQRPNGRNLQAKQQQHMSFNICDLISDKIKLNLLNSD